MNKLLTRRVLIILISIVFLASYSHTQPEVVDRVVGIVGREFILLSELNAQIEFYVFNNQLDPALPGLKQQVLDAMIKEKLILAKALDDTTITVKEEDITDRLDALIAQRVQQVGTEKRLEELYGMPVSRMKREFRDETRKQLLIQSLQQTKFNEIKCSRREVEAFLETYKDSLPKVLEELELYHIVGVPQVGKVARQKVFEKATKILDSIKSDGDFAEYARRYSEDAGTATYGGDLGFTRRGQFFKEFEEAVFSLKESEFANIVETPLGLHILQLLERRGESVHARHILFKIEREKADDDVTIKFLRSLKDSVNRGVSFSELAKRHSTDKESGPLGGFLGKFSIDQFDRTLLETVKNMKDDEISDPVPVAIGTSQGYHIVYLKRRIPEHAVNLNDDWKRVERLAIAYKQNVEHQKWIEQLRTEIYWETKL